MKKTILFILFFTVTRSFAQVPEDAARYSWYPVNGTARYMAIGGTMGSLGGDITAAYVNPAGLGLYNTSEFVFTPGVLLNNNRINYRGTLTAEKKTSFLLGPIGIIIGNPFEEQGKKHNALCIVFNQNTNFNNTIHYKSLNNYSSFSEQFAEELVKSGQPVGDFLYTNSTAPYSIAPAWNSYLIDTFNINGILQVRGAPENILDSGQAIQQEMLRKTYGGMYELALSFARSKEEKWLWGITIGIPMVYYKSNTTYTESDTSSNKFNGFKSFTYTDNFKTIGAGINAKLGIIYRPKEYIRLGLAVHTPSFLTLEDTRAVTINTQLESDSGTVESYSENSMTYTNGQNGNPNYYQVTPWRAMISASYVFREVENVKKQRAFISADIEYVHHKGNRFSSNNDAPTEDEKLYYKALNKFVKHEYKGTFNFRLGGEIKFNTVMARLGLAYYGSPYKDKSLKGSHTALSGGLGYRNKGFFVDLTYVHDIVKDVNFPYRLEDRANTYASTKNSRNSIIATIGWKF